MKIYVDKAMGGRVRDKGQISTTGTGSYNPPQGFNTWEDYFSWVNQNLLNPDGTFLISGSVQWLQNLDFKVFPLQYQILGRYIQAPEKNITIPANVSADPMFAVIYGDVFGNTGYILGTPAASPAIPHVNDNTQIQLLPVYIPGNGTAPGTDPGGQTPAIVTEKIYDENIEWTTAKTEESNLTISLADTTNPRVNTKHIRMAIAAASAGQYVQQNLVVNPVIIEKEVTTITDQTVLSFALTDLFPLHKSDISNGTSRVLTWLNWLQSNSLAIHLLNADTGEIYQFRVKDTSTFETWTVSGVSFSVYLPSQLDIEISTGTLPAGTYQMSIDRILKYTQVYSVQQVNQVFTPAAAQISFTRGAGAISAANGNILISIGTSKAWLTNTAILLQLYNGTTLVGSLTLTGGSYGFNPNVIGYQDIIIPFSAFNPTGTNISKLVIKPVYNWPNNSNFDIDNIILQTGTTTSNNTGGGISEVITDFSVTGKGTEAEPIILVNDEETPAALKYYGTNAAGVRGYHALPTPDNTYIVYNEAELLAAYTSAISYVGKAATIYIGATITLTASRSFIRSNTDAMVTFFGIGEVQVIAIQSYNFIVNNITFRNIGFTTFAQQYVTVQGGYASFYNCRWWSELIYNSNIAAQYIAIKVTGSLTAATGRIIIDGLYHASNFDSAINDGNIQPFIIQNTIAMPGTSRLYISIVRWDALRNFDNVSRLLLHATANTVFKVSGDLSWYYHADQVFPGSGNILSESVLLKKGSIDDLRADYIPTGTPLKRLSIDSNKKLVQSDLYPTVKTITFSTTPTDNFNTGPNAAITLTADVTTYTLSNVPDGAKGTLAIIQNGTGGFGINAMAHSGLTIQYLAGQAPTAANINSSANGHTLLNYERIGTVIYISFAYFNTAA
jgi:hypothetical protein